MPYANGVTNAEYHRLYRERNREKLRQYAAKNYRENKDAILARAKTWRANNPGSDRKFYIAGRKSKPWRFLVQAARKRALMKRIPFALTNEWAEARWTGNCELTGLPFNLEFTGKNGPMHRSPSIDRRIPSLGYIEENCRFVLHCVNSLKSSGTEEEMYEVAAALIRKNPR